MPNLTLSMIVKNEEKHLSRCLSSVKDVVDEIVVVDTGSTDKTLEIAESFGAKIFHFEWIDDFSAARNFALSKSNGDWILYLDADEELNSDCIPELKNYLTGEPSGIYCTIKSNGSITTSRSVIRYPRLFPNDVRIKFAGKVHEQIIESLNENKIPVIDSDIEIIHYGYAVGEESLTEKKKRNLSLLLADENKQTNTYSKLKLIQTLISLEKFDEAESRLNKIIKTKKISANDLSFAMFYMAQIKYEKNELSSALNYALKAFRTLNKNTELNYLLSLVYFRAENINESLKYLLSSIKLNKYLLECKDSSKSENILDQTDLFLRAINLRLRLNNYEDAEKLISDLSIYITSDDHNEIKTERIQSALKNLLLNTSGEDLDVLKNFISLLHLTTIIEIIKICNEDLLITQTLNSLLKIFPESSIIYKNLALLQIDADKEKAIELFNKSLEYEEDPSVYIHLISIYISINDFSKVKETLNSLQSKFSNKLQFKQKIDILADKLAPILKSTNTLQTN